MKPATSLSAFVLLFIAVAHLLRLVFSVPIEIGTFFVPMWPSAVAVVGLGALGIWLWREQRVPPR